LLSNTFLCPQTSKLPPSLHLHPLPSLSYTLPFSCLRFSPDFFLEDLPDDLLVASIDLPGLDGPATTDLPGMAGVSQPQQLPAGLNSTPPPPSTAQPRSLAPSVSPLAQPLSQQQSPATSVSPVAKPTPPPQSNTLGGGPLLNNSIGGGGGLSTSTAGAPLNTTVVSTSADPTPALPNISSTSATAVPYSNMATSVSPAMGNPRMPSASSTPFSYNSYSGGMTVSAGMNSQVAMQPQAPGMGGYLRHPGSSQVMGGPVMHGQQMVHSPNMMTQQQHRLIMRQRQMMHPGVHGGPMMSTHPQQSMGMPQQIHHSQMAMHRGAAAQQMGQGGMTMGGGGMMQPGAMHMNPGMHISYDPRTRMTMVGKPGIHHRMPGPQHVQHHPGMHHPRPQSMIMGGHPHQYMDPSGYQGHMQRGYSMVPAQNAVLPPHSHHQMMAPHMMTQQQQMPVSNPQQSHPAQQPRPPSEGVVGQGSPLPGQLGGPQLQIATPPQSQATPPSQQTTPQQPTPGQSPATSRPGTPQTQQQQLQQHLNAPPTSAALQRGSPVATGAMQQRAPSPAAPPQSVSAPQQQQTPPTQQSVGQTPPTQNFQQATPPQPLPPQSSAGQQPMPGSLPSLPSDYFSGKGGMPGQQPTQQQMIGSSPHGPGGGVNTFGAPPTSGGIGGPGGGGLGGANQQAATDP
jgi:hypothetical protein